MFKLKNDVQIKEIFSFINHIAKKHFFELKKPFSECGSA